MKVNFSLNMLRKPNVVLETQWNVLEVRKTEISHKFVEF